MTINLKPAAWVLGLGVVLVDFLSGFFSIANYFITHDASLSPEASKFWVWLFLKFYLDAENNFPTYYASFTILICAGLLAVITFLRARQKAPYTLQWGGLALIFLLMSIDEYMSFHEVLGSNLSKWLLPNGVLASPWVIPGAVGVLILGLAFVPFVFHLPPRTRNLVILSGAIYVFGALIMDIISGHYVTRYGMGNIGYELQVYVEETLEMIGIALFTFTLLDYLKLLLDRAPLELRIE